MCALVVTAICPEKKENASVHALSAFHPFSKRRQVSPDNDNHEAGKSESHSYLEAKHLRETVVHAYQPPDVHDQFDPRHGHRVRKTNAA